MKKYLKPLLATAVIAAVLLPFAGCSKTEEAKVVLYTNADEEAVAAMESALNNNGFSDQYILQTFGTSELGGKLMAEGKNIEADLLTMSSYYVDTAQSENQMFTDLAFTTKPLSGTYPSYATPTTIQEGALMINTQVLKDNNLPMPTSFKDLANPVYKGFISVSDIMGSSTAWLMVQAVISQYGETEGAQVLTDIYKNAGPHIESSGSGPLKKAKAGEVAVAFVLRHAAVLAKSEGLPVDYVDPIEGNFSLTESVAVVDKGENTNPKAMEMAQVIIEKGRPDLIKTYPMPLYEGETTDQAHLSAYPKVFSEPLTVELLKKHQTFSEAAKANAQK